MAKGLSNEQLRTVIELLDVASADECIAIAQRFNVQAQFLTNKAEQRLQRLLTQNIQEDDLD